MERIAATVVLVLSAALGRGQSPQPPVEPPSAAPLGGPAVNPAPDRTSLVERDYESRVKRLDVPPEEEAVKLLDLSDEERAATDRVLAHRIQLLDDFVSENFELLIRSAGAFASNQRAEQLRTVGEVFRKSRPLRVRGPLIDELAGALDPANADRLRALVADYWDALIRDIQQQGEARSGSREPRIAVLAREKAELLGREIQRSFQRQLPPGGEQEFDALLAAMELRPEQERKVRRMAEEFIIRSRFRPTEAQERRFILEVGAILDQRQRGLLAAHLSHQRREQMQAEPR